MGAAEEAVELGKILLDVFRQASLQICELDVEATFQLSIGCRLWVQRSSDILHY